MVLASCRWFWPVQDICGGFWMVVPGCIWLLMVLFGVGWFWSALDGSDSYWLLQGLDVSCQYRIVVAAFVYCDWFYMAPAVLYGVGLFWPFPIISVLAQYIDCIFEFCIDLYPA